MDVLDSRKVIIRKPQNCWGCRREFPKGTELVYVKLVDADGFSSCYWCPVCVSVMDNLPAWEKEDGFAYGSASPAMSCGFGKRGEHGLIYTAVSGLIH